MELSAKLLHDVEFKERWRGYDPDEVDAFLEQVARGVEALQERVRDAERHERAGRPARAERGERAEAREAGTEDELRRVLVLAQRTADTAVREARDEAERLVSEARAQAEQTTATADAYDQRVRTEADEYKARITGEADEYRSRTTGEADEYRVRVRREADEDVARRMQTAEDEVAQAGAGALARLNDEIARLEGERDGLQAQVAATEAHLGEHRVRARLTIEALQRLVDDPMSLGATAIPEPVATSTGAGASASAEQEVLEPELEPDELGWDDADDDLDEDAEVAEGDEAYAYDDELDDDEVEDVDDDEALDDLDASGDLDETDEDLDDELAEEDLDAEPAAMGGHGVGEGEQASFIDLVDAPAAPSLLDATTGELHLGDLDQVPDVAWGDGAREPVGAADGPATQAFGRDAVQDVDEDAYLAELRRAIADDESLSPAAEAFFNQAAYEDDRWKGLRRRR